jgi:phage gp46-like protein
MGDLVTNADGAGTGNSIENEIIIRDFISTTIYHILNF